MRELLSQLDGSRAARVAVQIPVRTGTHGPEVVQNLGGIGLGSGRRLRGRLGRFREVLLDRLAHPLGDELLP
jgi:hypothetical protein